jgi:hypothetical protein
VYATLHSALCRIPSCVRYATVAGVVLYVGTVLSILGWSTTLGFRFRPLKLVGIGHVVGYSRPTRGPRTHAFCFMRMQFTVPYCTLQEGHKDDLSRLSGSFVSRSFHCHFVWFPMEWKGGAGGLCLFLRPPASAPQALVEGPGGRAIIPLQMLTLYPF